VNLQNVPQSHIKGGVLLAIKLRCNHCNREKLPTEIATGSDVRGRICWNCLNNHHANLQALAGDRPRACNECRVSFDELGWRNPDATMVVVFKDAVLQLLCKPCGRKYLPKSHVYKNTEFARRTGIQAGNK
jgi:hypothetical protein